MQQNVETILAEDIVFKGNLRFKDSLQINGEFSGKIETSGHLIVEKSAKIKADIKAKSAAISGKLEGNISNADTVKLYKTGEVYGDIHTKDLYVESGSKFNGNCTMGQN